MVCRALGSKRDFSPALLETRAHGRLHGENWSGAIELTAFKSLAALCQTSSSAMLPQPWPFYAIWLHGKYFEGNVNPQ